MSTVNLDRLFNPKSIAVVGASDKKSSVGFSIMNNLLKNGFLGEIFPVNPKYDSVMGLSSFENIDAVGSDIDMAVITTPISSSPDIVESCGRAGAAGAVIVSAMGQGSGRQRRALEAEILKRAKEYNLRIIGPGCLGVVNTSRALNASFAHIPPLSGKIAFLSQSGAVCSSVLDLARREKIGFSHFISLGSMLDVDFADMIDYLGALGSVSSIVIYMENLTNIRNFMSAARAVSRVKPIIALKSGRSEQGSMAAASHTGAMTGEDALYDAAFRRAGILRVNTFEELLDCSAFLAKLGHPSGSGLTIITNAGGPGVMAVDALSAYGMEPVQLSLETIEKLDSVLLEKWSRGNPVNIFRDTPSDIYVDVMKICADARETDALLLICSPAGTMDTSELAKKLTNCLKELSCPIFTAWIGGDHVQDARRIMNQEGIVTYDSAERAVRAFKNFYQYARNTETLLEIPVRTDKKLTINRSKAENIIKKTIHAGSQALTEIQAKNLLMAYGIPVNTTQMAESENMAVRIAENMGYPVVLKICSSQILHKSDCNGVVLDLKTPGEVKNAFAGIMENARSFAPDALIRGVTVQSMVTPADYELIIGAKSDPKFGPVIVFGMGGVMTEVFKDRSMGLPPLNRLLAKQMIERTKVSKVMKGFRHLKPVNMQLLEELLIRTGRLVTDFPEITELDINPLIVKDGSITAVDARVVLSACSISSPMHLVISSYPWQYEKNEHTINGHVFFIRPIRPSDADLLIEHFDSLSPKSIYMRFFSPVQKLSRNMLVKLTQIDYDREIALVALMGKGKKRKMVGVCRILLESDKTRGEFATAISDDWQGKGIGSCLLKQCLKAAQSRGVKHVTGFVLAENTQMLMLARKLGFTLNRTSDSGEYEVVIDFHNMHFLY